MYDPELLSCSDKSVVEKAEEDLDYILPYWRDLDDSRQLVLIELSLEVGESLSQFKKFLAALHKSHWEQAAIELKKSNLCQHKTKYFCSLIRTGDGDDL